MLVSGKIQPCGWGGHKSSPIFGHGLVSIMRTIPSEKDKGMGVANSGSEKRH